MKQFLVALLVIGVLAGTAYLAVKMITSKKATAGENQPGGENTGNGKGTNGKVIGTEPVAEVEKPSKLGRPESFSYKNAINGDIKGIPTSKDAKTGILVDLDTREVLWAKNPRTPVPIASMTKMLTELLAFEELDKNKNITLDTPVQVSKTAMDMGGSQINLDVRETFTLGELLKTVMIVSANDSALLVSEFLSGGNTPAFVAKMNSRAKELMLPGAKFYNPHGLPGATAAEDNVCSPEGCIFLAEMLLRYPQAVTWASTKTDYLPRKLNDQKPTLLGNHNHLLGSCPGVNGMKTGFIQRSGFCITVTCIRGNKKLACAVTGFKTRKERDAFCRKLIDWGYSRAANMTSGTGGGTDVLDQILK